MQATVDFLAGTAVFDEIPTDFLKELLGLMKETEAEEDEEIFHEDDFGEDLFFILDGAVKLSVRNVARKSTKDELYSLLHPGEYFGIFSFIDGRRRATSAVAMKKTKLLMLARSDFDRLTQAKPHIALAVMSNLAVTLSEKLRNTVMLGRGALL